MGKDQKEKNGPNRRVFFDISINGAALGRMTFEMFDNVTPITCENFV